MATPKRILVAEDEKMIQTSVLEYLMGDGHRPIGVDDGRKALKLLETEAFDMVILDGHMPGLDGFKVLETIRTRGLTMPVLMLTARAGEGDRLLGFHLGADDYLVKPFFMSELGARVKVLLSRKTAEAAPTPIRLQSGCIVFDPFRLVVIKDGQPLDLLPKEAKILEAFLKRPGVTLSREQLVNEAWERGMRPTLRTVDAHVARLRRKLGADEDWLTTIPGEGYRWVVPVSQVGTGTPGALN